MAVKRKFAEIMSLRRNNATINVHVNTQNLIKHWATSLFDLT